MELVLKDDKEKMEKELESLRYEMSVLKKEMDYMTRWNLEATQLLGQLFRIHDMLPVKDQAPLGALNKTDAVERFVHKAIEQGVV